MANEYYIINPNIDKEKRLKQIFEFIKDQQFYCAVAYAKVCKLREDEWNKAKNTKDDYFNKLYTALAYAFDDPWYGEKVYDNFNFADRKIEDKDYSYFDEIFFDFLFLSISLRILYSHNNPNFPNKRDIDEIKNKLIEFEDYIKLENIFTFLYEFKKDNNVSFSFLADESIKEKIRNRTSNNKNVKEISLEQEVKKYISNNKDVDFDVRNKIFNLDSDLYSLLKTAVDENDYEFLLSDEIDGIEFYKIANNNDLKVNIAEVKEYVKQKAKKVDKKFENENSDKFKNICQDVEKLLDFVYSYLKNLSDKQSEEKSNTNIDIYIKAYNKIYSELESVIGNIKSFIVKKNREDQEDKIVEGVLTLLYIIYNIKDCISLDYKKEKYTYQYGKYFYVPFLLSDDVLLNETFLPDFPDFYFDNNFLPSIDEQKNKKFLESIMPEYLIIENAQKFKNFDYSLYNLKSKLEKKNDNYNYTTKKIIDKYLDTEHHISSENIKRKKKASKFELKDFYGKLELSECFCQLEDVYLLKIDELDRVKENSFNLYINFHENIDKFYDWLCGKDENFDYFKKIVNIYSKYIDDNSKILENYWIEKIKSKYQENNNESDKLLKFIEEYKNYSVIREAINNGYNLFEEDKELFKNLSKYIKQHEHRYDRALRKLERLINDIDDELSDENKIFLLNIARNWENIFLLPKNSSKIDKNKVVNLLSSLGFDIKEIKDETKFELIDGNGTIQKLNSYDITVSNNNYSNNHQFASFIPYLLKNSFRIIFIKEDFVFNNMVEDLFKFSDRDEIAEKNTIILFDNKIKLNEKRNLSEKIKTKRRNNNNLFLFIDRVVILFLLESFSNALKTAKEKTKQEQREVDVREILNDMLMSIILPFGFYQPYDSSTSGTANKDIMFVGRKEELDKIKNPTLPFMIVYGGRQLGKSLLLEQAEKDINRDKSNCIAIYCDIRNKEDFKPQNKDDYKKIYNDITLGYIGKKLREYNIVDKDIKEWKEFQKEIEKFLDNPQNINKKLYLFLDEVDDFVTSCKKLDTEAPFLMIKEIADKYKDKGRFNVVFAGLNLYVDFRGTNGFFAKNQNGIVGQLKKDDSNFVLIKPFDIEDAVELIKRPLHYLGLDFSKDLSLVYLILYNTNYYPCLIQMYCQNILENMSKSENYSLLYSDGPIYYLEQDNINNILIDDEFEERVKKAFDLTLQLNSTGNNDISGDNTFKYLANMLALLCHTQGYRAYKLEDFINLAHGSDNDIGKIEKICDLADEGKLEDLLDLLEKLSVFEKCGDKDKGYSYRFKRFSLYKLMDKEEDIRKKLKEYILEDIG